MLLPEYIVSTSNFMMTDMDIFHLVMGFHVKTGDGCIDIVLVNKPFNLLSIEDLDICLSKLLNVSVNSYYAFQ